MTTRRPRPGGRRIFTDEQAYALIEAYDKGATQLSLCRVAEEMVGKPVSLSTIRNLLHGRSYKGLAAQAS